MTDKYKDEYEEEKNEDKFFGRGNPGITRR